MRYSGKEDRRRPPWPDAELVRAAADTAGRHALESDVSGSLRQPTLDALTAAGFPGAFVPEWLGGSAATFDAVTGAVAAIAEECVSAGWIASLWAYNGRLGAYLPAEGQAEVWAAGPDSRLVSSMVASGVRAARVPGGWRLSGSWLCASGVGFADWALLSSAAPRKDDRSVLVFAVPRESFAHRDDWSTLGMRATGSHTLVVDRAFVPEHRAFVWDDLRRGSPPGPATAVHTAPLFAVNGLTYAAPILGAAHGALRLAAQRLTLPSGDGGPSTAARMSSRIAFARAAGEIDAAALLLSRVAQTADQGLRANGMAERNHRDSTLAVELLVEAVDRLFRVIGSRGQASSHGMQRIWRDVHAAGSHTALRFEPAAIGYARRLLST